MNDNSGRLVELLGHNWWLIAVRGIAAIIFGVLALLWPGITMVTLVLLFGAYALFDGIVALYHAFSAPKGYPRFGALLFNGLISIAAGILAFVWPGITALVLLFLIAGWAIITGFLEIATAIELRKVITGEWLMILAGIVSVLFGIFILMRPVAGALAVVWWIGTFAIIFGVLLITFAFKLRGWVSGPEQPIQNPT